MRERGMEGERKGRKEEKKRKKLPIIFSHILKIKSKALSRGSGEKPHKGRVRVRKTRQGLGEVRNYTSVKARVSDWPVFKS
jgi:hypothetical protein